MLPAALAPPCHGTCADSEWQPPPLSLMAGDVAEAGSTWQGTPADPHRPRCPQPEDFLPPAPPSDLLEVSPNFPVTLESAIASTASSFSSQGLGMGPAHLTRRPSHRVMGALGVSGPAQASAQPPLRLPV